MPRLKPLLTQIGLDLLQSLGICHPRPEQITAAESLITTLLHEANPSNQPYLTDQEWKCLYFAAHGKSAKETADILCLAVGTVNNYRLRAREKLGCKTLTQAVYTMQTRKNVIISQNIPVKKSFD